MVPNAPIDNLIILATQVSAMCAQDLLRNFGEKPPSDVFREHSLACYVTDNTSLKLRHEIGIDIIAWECD
jgi:hypothetical protein